MDRLDAGQTRDRRRHTALDLRLEGAAGDRQLDGDADTSAVDAHVTDHAERDDAAVEFRIVHVAERPHDRVMGDRGRDHMNIRAHGSASAIVTAQGP